MKRAAVAAISVAVGVLVPSVTLGTVLECRVTRKLDGERVYSADDLKRGQFSVRIEETTAGATLSRCSYAASQARVTCDAYEVDRVELDRHIGIKKFYVFRNQFDVQVFPDMRFVENNGRGGISFGTCTKR